MKPAIEFKQVDILFPPNTRGSQALVNQAFEALQQGKTRAQIQDELKVIVGVANASLSVSPGHISVLMGLSGSGKSTLLRAANRLNPVTRGEVWVTHREQSVDVAHCDVKTLREIRRHTVAMMFQQFGLLPWRTVRDNVGFGLELRGDPLAQRQKIVDEKLELVGLSAWANRQLRELSGGMQQRVGLARAFATDADILLMDEPFSALDPLIRSKLQDELLDLQQRLRKTILFVTHDLDEALKLGNQISILEGGRIVQTGSPEEIVLTPKTAYVAEFVQHMNPLVVLTGKMVMTRLDAHQHQWNLESDGRIKLLREAQGFTVKALDQTIPIHEGFNASPADIAACPAKTPLKELMSLMNHTHKPVLLTEGSQIIGFVGSTETIRALAHNRQPSA